VTRDERRQVIAFDQFHDDGDDVGALLEAKHLRDVGMIERSQRARLALETRKPIGIRGNRVGQHLDGDVTMQVRVARPEDFAHSPRTERREDFVGAKARADRQGHDGDGSLYLRPARRAGNQLIAKVMIWSPNLFKHPAPFTVLLNGPAARKK
jgi:hypothetical protein